MEKKLALKCENISIKYITGDFKDIGFKEYVLRKIKGNYNVIDFWADKNISFELNKGDMLGIIGSNGAGKTTLLKAISGVMIPTLGKIEINGEIAALLELGAGFDGELTVKENTYLRGALLGYTEEFMNRKYETIISFAELEQFQNRSFKQLSTGMKSRLAFSIACLVNPDILILDEVLAVGDGSFREKSGNKMKEILESGVTGIIVSHSVEQIKRMCNKVLWLDHGRQICFSDEVDMYLDAYEDFLINKQLPRNYKEAVYLSNRQRKTKENEEQEKKQNEILKLEKILELENEDVIKAALNIIKRKKPDLLNNKAKQL